MLMSLFTRDNTHFLLPFQSNGKVAYNLIGLDVTMGDHKVSSVFNIKSFLSLFMFSSVLHFCLCIW